ncbi:RAD55 family ATPase [Halosimplex sp. J119]
MARSSDSEAAYDLTDVLEFDALESVRPGSNILISGPAMSGKEDVALSMLADGAREGQGSLVVTTGDRAEGVLDGFLDRAPDADPSLVSVVDCRGDGSRRGEATASGSYVYHVSSPGDLTGIGIGITECLEYLHNNGADSGRFALTSLSTMLTYTDRKTVFKFCHVLSSRFDSAGYLGLFTIDSSAHDDQTLQVIKQAFDGMIEIRDEDGRREARVLGLAGQPTEWREF